MLTLFGIPKPFVGHFEIIQRNAIQSWSRLSPRCEILLFGNEKGTKEVAAEYGARHICTVQRNEFGTPLLNSIFSQAEREATQPVLCFLNSDIILMNDFCNAVQQVLAAKKQFLLIGRRWNIAINERLDFKNGWEAQLRARLKTQGRLDDNTAIDYFVFRTGLWPNIPAFAIGRPQYDNWLVYQANHSNIPVIDLTAVVTAVHQDHSRAHVGGVEGLRRGPEGQRNLALAGGYTRGHTIWDAKFKLTRGGLRRRYTLYSVYRRFVDLVDRHPSLQPALNSVRSAIRIARNIEKWQSN